MTETISSGEAQNNFGALLEAAQRNPVIVQRRNRDCAVIMSIQEYAEWQAIKNDRLNQAAETLAREAKARGLTPKKLASLLGTDDA